jgi:ubiquinone/menaquinone biosynthesis C-methylase UbiE
MSDYWKDYWNNGAAVTNSSYLGRVLRTEEGQPISEDRWQRMVDFVINSLEISPSSSVLDLCCGNGAYSIALSKMADKIIAVDCSQPLLEELNSFKIKNIETRLMDANALNIPEKFSHVIFMAAIQYFSEIEALKLLETVYKYNLEENGTFYIADVPDRLRLWEFVSSKHYENMYFDNMKNNISCVGTWFIKKELVKMAEYIGFRSIEIIDLPEWAPNATWKFNMKLTK